MRLRAIQLFTQAMVRIQSRLGRAGTALLALSAVLATILLAIIILPSWAEARIAAILEKTAPGGHASCEVRRIGLWAADLGQLSIGASKDSPSIQFSSCKIDYSPISLLKGRIDRLSVSDLQVRCSLSDGKLSVEGISAQAPSKKSTKKGFSPKVYVDTIEVRHGILSLDADGKTVSIPFELSLSSQTPLWKSVKVKGSFAPSGQRLDFECLLNADTGSISASMTTPEPLNLEALQDISGLPVSGTASISAKTEFEDWGKEIKSLSIDAVSEGLLCEGWRIASVKPGVPLTLSVTQSGQEGAVKLSPASLSSGNLKLSLNEPSASYSIAPDKIECKCKLSLPSPENSASNVSAAFSAIKSNGGWSLEASAKGSGSAADSPLILDVANWKLSTAQPSMKITSQPAFKDFNASLEAPELKLARGALKLEANSLSASLTMKAPGEPASLNASLNSISASIDSIWAAAPALLFTGNLSKSGFQGSISMPDASVSEANSKLELNSISFEQPIALPSGSSDGMLNIGAVSLAGRKIGGVSSKTSFSSSSFSISADAKIDAAPDLKPHFAASLQHSPHGIASKFTLAIPEWKSLSQLSLASIHPAAEGFLFSGSASLNAEMQIDPSGARRGNLAAKISDAKIEAPSKGFLLDGASLSFEMPDLSRLSSPSSQSLSFKDFKQGSISITDGSLLFRMDSPGQWLIENFSAEWCKGHIRTEAVKLSKGPRQTDLVIHCDRIMLSDFLSQMCVGEPNGDSGPISGIVPVSVKNTDISFHDGFLYSTPGETATLKLERNDALTAGLSVTPELQTQLDMTRMAMEDFIYSWVRVYLDTKGETFSLKIQMDGKPAKPLPFELSKETGYFVRCQDARRFQGIRLDVNFNLPLAKVFGINKGINRIMDKIGKQ